MKQKIFIPGVSEQDLALIQKKLATQSITEIKKAAKGKKIRKLKGLNGKIEMAVLRGIKLLEEKPSFLPIGIAYSFAQTLLKQIDTWPEISQVLLVGDLRRGKEEIDKIELLLEGFNKECKHYFRSIPGVIEVIKEEKFQISFSTLLGIPLILHSSKKVNWGKNAIFTTGSSYHLQALRKLRALPEETEERLVYKKLGLPFIPPEIRETGYEVNIAQEDLLPNLIIESDIKGDLHIHTRYSDGINTIEENVQRAIELGYQYLAITDHSQSLTVAGGLKAEDLARQGQEIDLIQKKYPQIKILKGIEVDILEDGSLDFTDDILNTLDIVIASIHSKFNMAEEEMTKRITKALSHPKVNILAHPTGRILGKRPGYALNIEEVIKIAAKYNKILEINASPDRLDLRDTHLQIAKTKGVKIVINTDSHSVRELLNMNFGVQMAKRGWQAKADVINTWDYEELITYLKGGNKNAD